MCHASKAIFFTAHGGLLTLPQDSCTCEKARDGGYNPANEIDFTTTR